MKAKFKILAVLCIFISSPLFADRMVSVCLFWNRSVDSVMVSAMSAPLKLKNSIIQSGDTVVLHSGEIVDIESDDYYAISDGRIWRMVSGKCYGRVGKNLYLKIPLRKWIMLTLMGEFPEKYPLEALKAGAVVLRSFVLSGKHHDECDVCDRTHCALLPRPQQIFKKYEQAVEMTKELVLVYNDTIIPAPLTANCGGRTIPAYVLWGGDAKWSTAVVDSYCEPYRWEFPATRSQLKRISKLPPEQWQIKHKYYDTISWADIGTRISGFAFWTMLVDEFGWGTLCSPTFEMVVRGDSVYFDGVGFGHRVGLCQNGARNMAKKGFTFDEILKYYFPKTKLKKLGGD